MTRPPFVPDRSFRAFRWAFRWLGWSLLALALLALLAVSIAYRLAVLDSIGWL